jgi:predicted transporter
MGSDRNKGDAHRKEKGKDKFMDLNIMLWISGTLFSLGIFAVKVGFGLGYGQVGMKGISATLAGYIALFILIAFLSEKLIGMIAPVLSRGPYLHIVMAAGMIAWGVYAVRGSHCMHRNGRQKADSMLRPSLLLIIPCPICLTAMTFSTWTALSVIKLPAIFVGLGIGISFTALALLFLFFARFGKSGSPETSLGLAMITIGLYYIAALLLPAKIEEARGIYASFVDKVVATDHTHMIGVLFILLFAMLIGYFGKQKEYKK